MWNIHKIELNEINILILKNIYTKFYSVFGNFTIQISGKADSNINWCQYTQINPIFTDKSIPFLRSVTFWQNIRTDLFQLTMEIDGDHNCQAAKRTKM